MAKDLVDKLIPDLIFQIQSPGFSYRLQVQRSALLIVLEVVINPRRWPGHA